MSIYSLISANGKAVVKKIIYWISNFDVSLSLMTDNWLKFKNSYILNFCELYEISIDFLAILHPTWNAIVERFQSTIIEHLRIIQHQIYPNYYIKCSTRLVVIIIQYTLQPTKSLLVLFSLETRDPFAIDLDERTEERYQQLNQKNVLPKRTGSFTVHRFTFYRMKNI